LLIIDISFSFFRRYERVARFRHFISFLHSIISLIFVHYLISFVFHFFH